MTGFCRCFRTILMTRVMVVSLPIPLDCIIATDFIEMSSTENPPDEKPPKGKFVVHDDGVFKIKGNGVLAVFNSEGECPECCECEPYTLATFITDGGTWDLTLYQGDGVAKKKRYWRLTNNYTGYVPIRRGCVDKNGKLVGLPSSISTTTYKYTWTFRIEIGCKEGNYIQFPTGTESASIYNCDF